MPDHRATVPQQYLQEFKDEELLSIFEFIIHCNLVEPKREFKKRSSRKIKAPPRILLQNDIHAFIVMELDDNGVDQKMIEYLLSDPGEKWENFRKIGNKKRQDTEGKLECHAVKKPAAVAAALSAAAQLTKTSLADFIEKFIRYCVANDVVISEQISNEELILSLQSKRYKTDDVSTGASDGEAYKDRLGRRIRGADKWLDAYNHDELPFVGRSLEQKRLDEFVKCNSPFKIWAIIAPSGAGKTRLMFQWVDTSPVLENWDCRKLEARDRDKPERWSDWSPDRPTLLTVDYMFGYERVLEELVKRGQYFVEYRKNNPRLLVRLLVIDHAMAEPMQSDKRWGLSRSGESLNFNERLFFDPKPLSLVETSDQENVISQIISTRSKLEPSDPKIEEAKEYLRRTNAAWHPLFAALVGDAVKEGIAYSAWNRRELIKYYLKGKALPWEDQGELGEWAACFIAAATARRGMLFSDLLSVSYTEEVLLPDDFETVINICHKIAPSGDTITLPPFEPDLLGESFFLLFLDKLKYLKKRQPVFMQVFISGDEHTVNNDAIEFIGFINRLTKNLLNDDPEHSHTKVLWQTLLEFLCPLKFPYGHPLRWAVNACLVEVMYLRGAQLPEYTERLLSKIEFQDFLKVNDADLIFASSVYSMRALEVSAILESDVQNIFNILADLWERNRKIKEKGNEHEPIFLAIMHGCCKVVALLVARDKSRLAVTWPSKRTPLMTACVRGHTEIARYLLVDAGVDVDAADSDGKTALIHAAQGGPC